ncbi:hypothetical protein BH09MYX1_BH09MYX1_41980 [soil metagenome]
MPRRQRAIGRGGMANLSQNCHETRLFLGEFRRRCVALKRGTQAALTEPLHMKCSRCPSTRLFHSHRRNVLEVALSFVGLRPVRCVSCGDRSLRFLSPGLGLRAESIEHDPDSLTKLGDQPSAGKGQARVGEKLDLRERVSRSVGD